MYIVENHGDINTMAPEEVLFNATIVLIPIWLGVARYIISETEFHSTSAANSFGLGMVVVLFGILYSMWISVQALAAQSEGVSMGFFILFISVGVTGVGGVLFIIREIDKISGKVVTGIPISVIGIGISVTFIPRIASRLLPQIAEQIPTSSVDSFFTFTGTFFAFLQLLIIIRLILKKTGIYVKKPGHSSTSDDINND